MKIEREGEYSLGDRVEFVVGDELHGMVTAYLIHPGGHVRYEVTWFHKGESKSRWCEHIELVLRKSEPRIGLKNPSSGDVSA